METVIADEFFVIGVYNFFGEINEAGNEVYMNFVIGDRWIIDEVYGCFC